jgi:transposase-like protein
MPRKAPATGTDADLNLATLSPLFVDETKAREFLESKRWPNGVKCAHCNHDKVYALTAKPESKKPVRAGVYKCAKCRQQFTVRVGTIFEDSKIPLCKWLMAIHLMTSSKKGVSSLQIQREVGVTYKSAWFLTHRIREAMKQEPLAGLLKGTLEADETYVGGRPRKFQGLRGRGTKKAPVVALVERGGRVRAKVVDRVSTQNLRAHIKAHSTPDCILMTDEFAPYTKIGPEFARHGTVNHRAGEYCRDDVSVNTAESFFALLKRGHYGIFHLLSKRHLQRYVNEFAFRWDHRKVSDGERMVAAIKGAEGKRLMYREPVRKLA